MAALTFGTAYYPDHWPEHEWDQDLARMAAARLTFVRFGEFSWSWFEPQAGQFEWQGYDHFLELAQKHKLRVLLCTPTATPPPWFIRRYPDGRLRDHLGNPCHSHRHFWCWNHAASRARAFESIRVLAERYAHHPVVEGWQIDNEPNYSESKTLYDFHPETMALFREWLKEKYAGSLEALNRAWYTNFWSQRYGDWEDIGALIPHTTNPNACLDFVRFREWNLAEFVHAQRDLIRSVAPNQSVGTNIPETGAYFSYTIGQDYRAQAQGLDWAATDLYCATGQRAKDLESLAFSTDLMRDAVAPAEFQVMETQGGPHQRTWPQGFAGEAFGPDYLIDSVQTYATHGAKKIAYFLWRPAPGGVEMGMNGVQFPDGSDSERTSVVRELAGESATLEKLREQWNSRPEAFIHYSRETIRFLGFFGEKTLENINASLRGTHRMFEDAGYRVTFVFEDDLNALISKVTPGAWLALPQTQLLHPGYAATIKHWSEMGGQVLAGPHLGAFNAHGHLNPTLPGDGLHEWLGLRLGFWHDIRTEKKLRKAPKKLPSITGYRAVLPAPPLLAGVEKPALAEPVLFFKKEDLPAAFRLNGTMWCAFDFGVLYDQADGEGRDFLRARLLSGAPPDA